MQTKGPRARRSHQLSFDTPLQIFGRDIKNSFAESINSATIFPQRGWHLTISTRDSSPRRGVLRRLIAPTSTGRRTLRFRAIARNKFNLTPSVSLAERRLPGPFWVARSERTTVTMCHSSDEAAHRTGLLTHRRRRSLVCSRGLFGPFESLRRHSITPSISYNYFAPAASVSDEYLIALGRTRAGYLESL